MSASISGILAKTLATVKERFGAMLGLWAIYFVVLIAVFAVFVGMIGVGTLSAFGAADPDSLGAGAIGAGMIGGMLLLYILYFLVAFAQSSSMIAMASPLERPSLGDAFKTGLRSAPTMLGVVVLLLICYFVAAFAIGLVVAGLSAVNEALSAVSLVLIVPAMVWLFCRLMLVNAVVPLERKWNPLAAIGRTWAMTRGNALTIFLVLLIFLVGAIVVGGVLFYPFYSSIMASAISGEPPDLGGMGFTILAFLLGSIVFSIVFSALYAAMHAELAGPAGTDVDKIFA